MNHLPLMIIDLAVILGAAAISILVFSRLKQPIVLGYLIAGFLVGPHVKLLPTVVDLEGIKLWAEIGVIFLLFGLGLEFSFKKLAKVGKSASIAAGCEVITMIGVGYLLGRAFGWKEMDSLYLGAILSMSSTTIIIRAFEETGLKTKDFASLVFGILIVEDLLAILIMVFLTEISQTGNFALGNILYLTARLGFFLLVWFLVGIYVLPTLLKNLKKYLSDEILLILSMSFCFLMVYLASKAGFSAALGAFIMGSILAETSEAERIEHLLLSVKNLFAAVFFVSVGMLIDPVILKENFGVVLLITLVTIVGKFIGSGFGAMISGQGLKKSVQAGMSLAQIGEFSFIIATLGMTLKVTSAFLYPIVIAVSAVTTFTTPYMIKSSGPFYRWVETKIPAHFLQNFGSSQKSKSTSPRSRWNVLGFFWRVYGVFILINSVVVIAITLASVTYLLPFVFSLLGDMAIVRIGAGLLTFLVCSPFLAAIILKIPKNLTGEEAITLDRWKKLQFGAFSIRFVITYALIVFIVGEFSTRESLFLIVGILLLFFIFAVKSYLRPVYNAIEKRFLENLKANDLGSTKNQKHA